MRFAQPTYLWCLLLVIPALVAFFFWAAKVKEKLMAQFIQARLLNVLTIGVSPGRQKLRTVLLITGVALCFLALARPQWGFVWEETRQQGLDIVVAIDTSRSMLASDIAPNRLTRAKMAAFELMRLAKNDRLGLIAFAGTAFLQTPLTLDEEAFRQNVDALDVNIIPEGGTALKEAIGTASEAFEKGSQNHKVLVLFTDGEDHDQDKETIAAAEAAAKDGMKIFTIGIGTAEGELLRVQDEQGNPTFVKDDEGNVVKSRLNETLLQKIATAAGGFYLPLRGANPIDTLYARGLAPLPKSDSATKLTRIYKERFHWPLGLAILCLALEVFLPDLKRVRQTTRSATPSSAAKAAVLAMLLLPALVASASPSGALRQYNAGKFDKAFQEYERLSEAKTNDYRLHYNAGTAAYRAKDYESAQKHLNATLNAPEIASDLNLQQRAHYNLGNALFQLGVPAEDPKQQQDLWEKSIENYTHALRLNPKDTEATNNLVFVRKKLEELKKQQQQSQGDKSKDDKNKDQENKDQQNQQQDKNQNKDQQKDKQEQQQNASKDEQKQQQQQAQNQDKQKQEQQQANQSEQQKQQEQQKQTGKKDEKKDKEQQAASEANSDQKNGETNGQASATIARMTPQQARQFLDAQKQDEKALIFMPEKKPEQVNRRTKNW